MFRRMSDTMLRACPNCAAQYKVVRIEVVPTDAFREITCKACGGPLQGREGRSIFKYFLVSEPERRRSA